jgi:SOS-response transcriptional repressor LexA
MGPVLVQTTREGQFLILQYAGPGRPVRNIGILLLDPASGRVHIDLLRDFSRIADPDDEEVLACLKDDLEAKSAEMGGEAFLRYLEDTLSNVLLVTERETVRIEDGVRVTLARLFDQHVEKSKVVPFVTHLPLYSLRAAAGKFGEDMEVAEEDWLPAPERLRLTEDMFVARVVGRSMEPRIPDGSLCVFRYHVVGSRQGKLLLVELLGATDSSARYTVKRYTSRKVSVGEDEWRHESIRLEPLNPEYEPIDLEPDRLRVIGEFIQVLE